VLRRRNLLVTRMFARGVEYRGAKAMEGSWFLSRRYEPRGRQLGMYKWVQVVNRCTPRDLPVEGVFTAGWRSALPLARRVGGPSWYAAADGYGHRVGGSGEPERFRP
jgi:hypothetical protein